MDATSATRCSGSHGPPTIEETADDSHAVVLARQIAA
jgi:hypothetical protein